MTEAEILQNLFASVEAVVSLFSTFLGIVFAYVAGLYFFLNRAPVMLKFLAYALLSIGLAFVGTAAVMQQRLQEQLFGAWAKLPTPTLSLEELRNPVAHSLPLGLSLYEIGIAIAWVTALGMYIGLGYMTFIYRWKSWEVPSPAQ
jgi:hypothetical protein